MKRFLLFLTVFSMFSAICSSPLPFRSLTKREQKFKKDYLYKLAARKGYKGNKAWDKFISMAKETGDKEVIKFLLSIPIFEGVELVTYSKDLFSIFKARPQLFMTSSLEVYKKNYDCMVYQFGREPEVIYKSDLKSLMSTFKSEELVTYRERVNEYWNSKKKVLNFHGCRKSKMDYFLSKTKNNLQKK